MAFPGESLTGYTATSVVLRSSGFSSDCCAAQRRWLERSPSSEASREANTRRGWDFAFCEDREPTLLSYCRERAQHMLHSSAGMPQASYPWFQLL